MKKIKENEIINLFNDYKILNNVPVLVTKLPEEIFNELIIIIEHHRKIKEHKLNFLFEHYNRGLNSYQISVQKPIIETSFIFPYLIALGQFYLYKLNNISFEKSHRKVLLRENVHHYDGYDIWINYTNKGDENPYHTHSGVFSGVIYIKNTKKIPTIFDEKEKYYGTPGEIAIFPANLEHKVEKQIEDYERITMSFNLYLHENNL
jgi:hypothetical protein